MRGIDSKQTQMFSYVAIDDRIPSSHPLRVMRDMTDFVFERMSRKFNGIYSPFGRPSIPPERLLRALLLQAMYSIRSERLLMEQLNYNLLFRWFVGLNPDDPVWVPTVFAKNRDRFLKGNVARQFLREVVALARNHGLMSDEHFTVDGSMIQSLASLKSFQPKAASARRKDGGGSGDGMVDFRGQRRRNDTHQSTTDPESRLYRKGNGMEAKLAYIGSVLMENRNGLVVDCDLRQATGTAEREASLKMAVGVRRRRPNGSMTLAADKGYDTHGHIRDLRKNRITPHIAAKKRYSGIDRRTTRHQGYAISQKIRKRVEEIFGWGKTIGGMGRSRFFGMPRTEVFFCFTLAVYDLVRMTRLVDVGR